jgi:hypothetical protein
MRNNIAQRVLAQLAERLGVQLPPPPFFLFKMHFSLYFVSF